MKIPKEARKLSRTLYRASFTNGRLDKAKVGAVVQHIVTSKPRHYLAVLRNYQRLLRMELERRHAVIESAVALDQATSDKIVADLKARYGDDITTELKVTPELIGGLRVRIGSDVWDGSIAGRLAALRKNITSQH